MTRHKSILKDPFLSNILAGIISTAIGEYLFQNLWVGLGIALLIISSRVGYYFFKKPYIRDGSFLGASPGPEGIFIQNYQTEARSRTSIKRISGYIKSNITGEKFPILLRGSDGIYPPEEAYEISKGAEFGISAFFVPFKTPMHQYDGIEYSVFLNKLSDFTLYLDVDDDIYKYHYPPKKVRKNIDQFLDNNSAYNNPRVTRKG
ncbi:MAG: hypothetical protein HYZ24_10265 [Chloroflexi bacterium]|nr:hypothetical protein [Chloroflexota bacterium]